MKLNKIDDVWNSANTLFKWRFRLLSSRSFTTMATWRHEISSLFNRLRVFQKSGCASLRYFKIRFLISDSFDSLRKKNKLRIIRKDRKAQPPSWAGIHVPLALCGSYIFTGTLLSRCTVFRSCPEKRTHHESFDLMNRIAISLLMFTNLLIFILVDWKANICFLGFNNLYGVPQRNVSLIQDLDIIPSERPHPLRVF